MSYFKSISILRDYMSLSLSHGLLALEFRGQVVWACQHIYSLKSHGFAYMGRCLTLVVVVGWLLDLVLHDNYILLAY